MLNSINALLEWVNNNWSQIIILLGLLLALYQKIKTYLKKSNDEKIEMAKKQISEIMLKLVSDAEEDYETIRQSGEIKRAQVLQVIYEKYPVLAKVMPQEELIAWLDEQIDLALETLRDILENKEVEQ